jgi:hypothetical protein
MNTSKFTSAITTLSLVLFMSIASIADANTLYSGDLSKSGDKSVSVTTTAEKDLNYLRFDVNKYVNENETAEVAHSSLDYLRFDVNTFINESDAAAMELPVANEFDYLRFDVNNFTTAGNNAIDELPVTE